MLNKDLDSILAQVNIHPISLKERIKSQNVVQRAHESWWRYFLLVHEERIISAIIVAFIGSVISCLFGGLFYFFEFTQLGQMAVGTAIAVSTFTLIITMSLYLTPFNQPKSYRSGIKAERYKSYLPETSQRHIAVLREHTRVALDFTVHIQRFKDKKTGIYTDFCVLNVELGQKEATIDVWVEKDSSWI